MTVMNIETFNKVKELLVEHAGISEREVSPETTLFGDTGMDGDDAYDFFVDFAEKFSVDMSSFEFSKHFGPEAGSDPITFVYMAVRTLLYGSHKAAGVVPITVADLVEAAERKRWPEFSEMRGGKG
jgi:acyl carrier protein